MNHSHARTAARRAGVRGPGKPGEDQLGGRLAHRLHHLAHLRHRARAAHELGVGVAVLLHPAQERVEAGRELLRGRQRGVGRDQGRQLGRLLLERRDEVGLLAGEVVVQQRLRDPRLAGDRRHRELVVVVAREQRGAELEQPAAALLDVEAGVGGAHTRHSVSRAAPTLLWWIPIPTTIAGVPSRSTRSCSRPSRLDVETYLDDAKRIERIDEELAMGFSALGPRRQGGLDLRLRPHAARPPGVRPGARGRPPAGRRGLRDHHRRRARDHGGGQPRRRRGRRVLDRPRHRAPARAGLQRVGRPRADLPLLLHAQGHVRPLRERLRGLPRRLRHARRALRGRDAAPDRARSATSRSCSSAPPTGRASSTG